MVYAAKGISSSILGQLLIYFVPTLAYTIAVGTLLGTRPKEFYVWYDVYPPQKSISVFDSSVVLPPLVACGLLWKTCCASGGFILEKTCQTHLPPDFEYSCTSLLFYLSFCSPSFLLLKYSPIVAVQIS